MSCSWTTRNDTSQACRASIKPFCARNDWSAFKLSLKRDLGGMLLYDPVNVRYATDCRNMQIWTMHNSSTNLRFVQSKNIIVLAQYLQSIPTRSNPHRSMVYLSMANRNNGIKPAGRDAAGCRPLRRWQPRTPTRCTSQKPAANWSPSSLSKKIFSTNSPVF